MHDEKNFILVGTDSTNFSVQASKQPLFSPIEFAVPVWTSFRDITDPAQITNLTVRANTASKKFHPYMPISPFLATVLIDQGGTSIPDLISTTVTIISSFTAAHEGDSNFPPTNNQAQPIVNWLWATMKDIFLLSTLPHTSTLSSSLGLRISTRRLSTPSSHRTKNQRSKTLRLSVNLPPTCT